MRQIRLRAALLAGWLIFIYSIDRLIDPVGITSAAYLTLCLVALFALLAPRMSRDVQWVIVAILLLVFLAAKVWTGASVLGAATLLTITEAGAIVVTFLLARWVSSAISEFENVIAHITMGQLGQVAEPPLVGQGLIYREVRRARIHERPLTLIAAAIEDKSVQIALDRMVQEAQLAMIKQYARAAVSKALRDDLEDCDVVVQSDDYFLIALPEVTPEQLPHLVERLRGMVSERVGVTLSIGVASLPRDALTFEGLTDKAVRAMKSNSERQTITGPLGPSVGSYTA
jgi:GGDEF domain-containing protein